MKNWYFNIVVNKLRNYKWKIITIQKIKNIVHNILDDEYNTSKAYRTIHQLKSKWHIISIKKDILLVKQPDIEYNEDDIVDKYYRSTIKTHCRECAESKRYIWWNKALELNINNFRIPDEIDIYNKDKNATEVAVLNKKIIFKTYNNNKKNLRPTFAKMTKKLSINNLQIKVANLELAMLESLSNPSMLEEQYNLELCKQILRKKWKYIEYDVFRTCLRVGKHHASCNRLLNIAKSINPTITENIEKIIKKYSYILAK